jgi:hypothetical protein
MNEMELATKSIVESDAVKIRENAKSVAAYAITNETHDTLDACIEIVRWMVHLANAKEK